MYAKFRVGFKWYCFTAEYFNIGIELCRRIEAKFFFVEFLLAAIKSQRTFLTQTQSPAFVDTSGHHHKRRD